MATYRTIPPVKTLTDARRSELSGIMDTNAGGLSYYQ
jgi:hypothetical protein